MSTVLNVGDKRRTGTGKALRYIYQASWPTRRYSFVCSVYKIKYYTN